MQFKEISPTILSFNTCINGLQSDRWPLAVLLLAEALKLSLEADQATYTNLIAAVGATGQWQRCLAYLELLKGVGDSVLGWNAAMAGCNRAHRWREALLLFQQLQREGGEAVSRGS